MDVIRTVGPADRGAAGAVHELRRGTIADVGRDDDLQVLCCLLWAREGREAAMRQYEDQVLALLGDHGGRVRQRVLGSGEDGHPHEVQLIEFATGDGLERFLRDPRRLALAGERDRSVARTESFPVTPR